MHHSAVAESLCSEGMEEERKAPAAGELVEKALEAVARAKEALALAEQAEKAQAQAREKQEEDARREKERQKEKEARAQAREKEEKEALREKEREKKARKKEREKECPREAVGQAETASRASTDAPQRAIPVNGGESHVCSIEGLAMSEPPQDRCSCQCQCGCRYKIALDQRQWCAFCHRRIGTQACPCWFGAQEMCHYCWETGAWRGL